MGISEAMQAFFEGLGLPAWLVVVLLTITPILEVRASIPVAMLVYAWSWLSAFVVTFLSSLLIVPIAYAILIGAERLARHSRHLARGIDWLWARTRRKSERAEKAGKAGLFAIVALPLPGAGTYTACLTAYVLGMDWRKALPTIVLGAAVECAILVIVVIFFQGALDWLA